MCHIHSSSRTSDSGLLSLYRMTSYIAHHTKKKQILARKEAALQRLVDSAAPAQKLNAAADAIREARIRVLRVQRSIIVPTDEADVRYAKIDSKIHAVSETSTASILAEFGCATDSSSDDSGND